MGRDIWPDLSVQISRRRWRCVPDPHLCLSSDGAAFVRALTAHAEVWLGPEFLNILDSWMLYDREPELLASTNTGSHAAHEIRGALRTWLRLREESGPASGRLFWVRDALRESCLPSGTDEAVVPRWEAMAEALDERVSGAIDHSGPLVAAVRDAVALAGVLPGTVLLGLHKPDAEDGPPPLCRHLEAWHLPCRQLDSRDDLVAIERGLLFRLLTEAGLAGYLWAGLSLAVVHLMAPGSSWLRLGPDLADIGDEPRPVRGAWEDAQTFWYDLSLGNAHAGP